MEPIGIIHSPFNSRANMPVQPGGAADIEGEVHENTPRANDIKGI